jgi:hypothetical protein
MSDTFVASYIGEDISIQDLDNTVWTSAQAAMLTKYWSDEDAPVGRHAESRALWSNEALYVRFVCNQTEPLVISDNPQTEIKTIGLWDNDVCEIFIAPNLEEPRRYFEFEVAPTGEWLDFEIHQMPERRKTNSQYHSGMITAARIDEGCITLALRVPWSAFKRKPQPNERWRANLFRCVGSGATRGYLAWRPTLTTQPNFHVPGAFGWLLFQK